MIQGKVNRNFFLYFTWCCWQDGVTLGRNFFSHRRSVFLSLPKIFQPRADDRARAGGLLSAPVVRVTSLRRKIDSFVLVPHQQRVRGGDQRRNGFR